MSKNKLGMFSLGLLLLISGMLLLKTNALKGLAADNGEAASKEATKKEENNREVLTTGPVEESVPIWPASKAECSEEQLIAIAEYVISKDTAGKYDDSQFPGQFGDALIQAKYAKAWHEYFQDLPPEEPQQVPYFEQLFRDGSTEEQMKLRALHPDISAVMMYPRDTLIITGKLPAETPRLTLDQAKEICGQIEGSSFGTSAELESYIYRCFNQIAGAPDFYGGSGMVTIVYYLHDNDHSELVWIMEGFGGVIYEKWEGEESYKEALYLPQKNDR